MKTRNLIQGLLIAVVVVLFASCENNDVEPQKQDYGILPERFKVDIPSSISKDVSMTKSGQEDDTLSGDEIYEHLTNFIAIGEGAADIVEAVIWSIAVHKIDQVKLLTYVSDEDGREKRLVVTPDVEFDGRKWEYQLTISDVLLEGNADKGVGMQVFWNKSKIAGICLIKPSNLNQKDDGDAKDAMFSIEYIEEEKFGYEAHMIVEISGMPLTKDPFAVDNLKMFVGKKGDMVDVYGNSNHPNAKFNYHGKESGFNWAFVASGHDTKDIGIAEVGLPASNADINSRKAILEDNSVKSVLSNEITAFFVEEYKQKGITLKPEEVATYIAPYLKNADAPGFFNKQGFVQSATSPGADYDELATRIKDLTPYNPKAISELSVDFKK